MELVDDARTKWVLLKIRLVREKLQLCTRKTHTHTHTRSYADTTQKLKCGTGQRRASQEFSIAKPEPPRGRERCPCEFLQSFWVCVCVCVCLCMRVKRCVCVKPLVDKSSLLLACLWIWRTFWSKTTYFLPSFAQFSFEKSAEMCGVFSHATFVCVGPDGLLGNYWLSTSRIVKLLFTF